MTSRTVVLSPQKIKDVHMKYRCMCMMILCGISAYDLMTHSLYDPIVFESFSISTLNVSLFFMYMIWDSMHMLYGKNRIVLYRNDLIIHHISSVVLSNGCALLLSPLYSSRVMFGESVSILNYILRDNVYEIYLHIYRIVIILTFRIPFAVTLIILYLHRPDLLAARSESTAVSIPNMQIWITNQAKFRAAKEWADKRGYRFGVIDENFLFKSR